MRTTVAWRALLLLAAAKLAVHLVAIERYGYFRDELYYLASTDHLAWGYVDFEEVEAVGRTTSPWAMPYEQGLAVTIARRPKADLREIWPQVRRYI
jgi:hypothetical protein